MANLQPIGAFGLKPKGSASLKTENGFMVRSLPKGCSGKNSIYMIFSDQNLHDAEISAERQCGADWKDHYELVAVAVMERSLTEQDKKYLLTGDY